MDLNLFKETKTRNLFFQFLASLIITIILLISIKLFFKQYFIAYSLDLFLSTLSFTLTLIWFILVIKFLNKNKINIFYFIGKPSKRTFIFETPFALILTLMGGIGALLIVYFIAYSIKPSFFNSVSSTMISPPASNKTQLIVILNFIGSAILAPITEEFIFRGILLNRFHNKYGIKIAVFLSSIIFMFCHLNPNPQLFFAGISCCILVYKYNSLIPGILLHCFNNLIVCLRDLNNTQTQSFSNNFDCNPVVPVIGSILLLMYTIYIYKNFPKSNYNSIQIYTMKL